MFDIAFSKHTFKGVMFDMVELVDQNINYEIMITIIAVMHNGKTYNGTIYSILTSFLRRIK